MRAIMDVGIVGLGAIGRQLCRALDDGIPGSPPGRRHRARSREGDGLPEEPRLPGAVPLARRAHRGVRPRRRGVDAAAPREEIAPKTPERRPRSRRALVRRAPRPAGLDRPRGGESLPHPRALGGHRRPRRRQGREGRRDHLGHDGESQAAARARRRAVDRAAEDRSRRDHAGDADLRGHRDRGLPGVPGERERRGGAVARRHRPEKTRIKHLRVARAAAEPPPHHGAGRVRAARRSRSRTSRRKIREPASSPTCRPSPCSESWARRSASEPSRRKSARLPSFFSLDAPGGEAGDQMALDEGEEHRRPARSR